MNNNLNLYFNIERLQYQGKYLAVRREPNFNKLSKMVMIQPLFYVSLIALRLFGGLYEMVDDLLKSFLSVCDRNPIGSYILESEEMGDAIQLIQADRLRLTLVTRPMCRLNTPLPFEKE